MSELRVILRHAGTVLVGQLAVMAFGVADTMIAGRHSPQALATLSLASSIYISIYVALNGLIQALLPVWAELHGANRGAELGQSVRQALYVCAMAAVIGIFALCFPEPWLAWTDVPPALRPQVHAYLQVLALALMPSLLFRLYGTLNQSLGLPRLVTWLQAGALLVKVPLSALLTFGWGQWAGLGVVGCAWATLAVNALMLLTGVSLLRTQDIYRPYRLWKRMEAPDARQLRRFLALGIPAGLSIMVEVTSFTLMALFIARMGEVALASHQIAASMAAVLYMVPLSLGIATSARAGYWIGAGQPARARKAAHTGLAVAATLAVLCAGALALSRHAIAATYAKDLAVASAAAVWLGWVAAYHLTDALQAVCVFVLRCWRITLSPLLIYTALLWGMGLYGGYLLAYKGLGPWPATASVESFWLTSTLALALVSLLFLARLEWAMRRAPAQP
ncbi:MAG: MATE family efflux transporter [Limnohabitans sp.]|nr:MAG: MATE family efflux transporter [Limnohabitans sp.]